MSLELLTLKVHSDARKINKRFDAETGQQFLGADTRKLKYLRAMRRAGSDDNLASCVGAYDLLRSFGLLELHRKRGQHRLASLEFDQE